MHAETQWQSLLEAEKRSGCSSAIAVARCKRKYPELYDEAVRGIKPLTKPKRQRVKKPDVFVCPICDGEMDVYKTQQRRQYIKRIRKCRECKTTQNTIELFSTFRLDLTILPKELIELLGDAATIQTSLTQGEPIL